MDRIASALDDVEWRGPDPYDALLSPIGRLAVRPRLRQALLQTVKRSPVDLRPLLRIQPLRTAASTGLGAAACARVVNVPGWADRAGRLRDQTLDAQLSAGSHPGLFAYEFDVQTRWSFYGARCPNIVATAFAADGLLALTDTPDESLVRLAQGLLDYLARPGFFAYTPESDVLIHNGNALGASVAARLARHPAVPEGLKQRLQDRAADALVTTLTHQRPDGSWPYGVGARLDWVDGFHSAYLLIRVDEAAATLGLDVSTSVERGARYYLRNFFDGAHPLYYPGSATPRDGNNVSTALRAVVWAAERGYVEPTFVDRVFNDIVAAGWVDFCAGDDRQRRWRRLPYPRWESVPLLDALTALWAWS